MDLALPVRAATVIFIIAIFTMFCLGSAFALNELLGFWPDAFDILFGIYSLLLAIATWARPTARVPARWDRGLIRLAVLCAGWANLMLGVTALTLSALHSLPLSDAILDLFGRFGEPYSLIQVLGLFTTGLSLIAFSGEIAPKPAKDGSAKSRAMDRRAGADSKRRRPRSKAKKQRRAGRRRHR